MPAYAMLLARRHSALAAIVLIAGAVVALAGASRATLGLFGGGLLLTTLLSLMHRRTTYKMGFAVVTALALAASVPAMLWAIDRRGEEARLSSNDQRAAMIRATQMMIADNPLGVGPNQFVSVAVGKGYSERAGVVWAYSIRSQPVHNSYYLIWAESGLLGLAGFLLLAGTYLIAGYRRIRRPALGDRSEVYVGLYAATIVALVHAYFEWISLLYTSQAVVVMGMGAVIGTSVVKRARGATRSENRLIAEAGQSPGSGPAAAPWA